MTKSRLRIQRMCIAALLCAIGILIPLLSPIKLQLGPMSFTLASHVALFIAMFISPAVSACVALGTTLGFLLAGFPPVVVLRAGVQIVFAVVGALWLAKNSSSSKNALATPLNVFMFAFIINIIHAVCEAFVVISFWFSGATYDTGFWYTILVLVIGGTLVHGIVDFYIALVIWRPVQKAFDMPASYTF